MSNNYKLTYNVDMVFCIDATGSMNGVIEMVKENAIHFYSDVTRAMQEKNKTVSSLRVRLVVFRDYIEDGKDAMLVTDFFPLPEATEEFEKCVHSIQAFGGGDDPEDGLEALAYAIKSPWNEDSTKKRHVIVVWTDAPTHPLGYAAGAPSYPSKMAHDFPELTAWWGDDKTPGVMNESAKRLLLFAPDDRDWNTLSTNWNNVIHYPSTAGNGLQELDYEQIISVIAQSV